MKKEFYEDDNGNCYIVGTTAAFSDRTTMYEWAEEEGYEMELAETPEDYDFNKQRLVW